MYPSLNKHKCLNISWGPGGFEIKQLREASTIHLHTSWYLSTYMAFHTPPKVLEAQCRGFRKAGWNNLHLSWCLTDFTEPISDPNTLVRATTWANN